MKTEMNQKKLNAKITVEMKEGVANSVISGNGAAVILCFGSLAAHIMLNLKNDKLEEDVEVVAGALKYCIDKAKAKVEKRDIKLEEKEGYEA